MKQIPFARGVGLGISVGIDLGMAMNGKRKHVLAKSKVGKTIKAVSDVMEDLTDAIGL